VTAQTAREDSGSVLALGFGTTVAMWALGYFCRLFGDALPAPALFGLFLLCQLAGGFFAGRLARNGLRTGVLAGLLTGALNLLIVGSLISGETPNAVKHGALMWVPGTVLIAAILGGAGALAGRSFYRAERTPSNWPGVFAAVAVAATFVLLAAGGLVTGFDEGLAVVDWPNTEGYNMFLYPLARMTGGVYLEHAHRLLGSLVGLTTLVLAIHTQVTARDRRIKLLAWTALLLVVIQGMLGGLRVTGRLTLSTQPADTSPSVILAIVHGVFGQIVFVALVALAVCRARAWSVPVTPAYAPAASTDRTFTALLLITLIGQLVLGALVRHFTWALDILRYGLAVDPARLADIGQWALHAHITLAVVVALLAVAVGVRAWGLYRTIPVLNRLGRGLLLLIGVQIVLGVAALIVTGDDAPQRRPRALDVAITTAHQVVGAALLALAVMLLLWNYRRLTTRAAA